MNTPTTAPRPGARRRWRVRPVIAATTVSALAMLGLAACGSSNEDSNAGTASNSGSVAASDINIQARDDIQDGGTLTLPTTEIAEQQNTFHADGNLYTKDVWKWYNPQVALFDGDGNYQANPDYITEATETTEDGKTVLRFTINDQAEYNDGTPIDWTSFENTWKSSNGEAEGYNISSSDGYSLIESVSRGDNDKQAVVTFSQEYPWWQGLFNYFVPPQVNDAETFNTGYLKKVRPEWGAGPYTIDRADFNTGEVSFKRNDNWWGEPGKLDTFTWRALESQATINAFQAGEIDSAAVATKDNLATARSMGEDKADIRTAQLPANYLVTLNSEAPLLEDVAVREALMTGIDRSQLATIRFNGLNYTEDLPGSFTLFQTQDGYEDNFGEVVSFDQDKAKELLDDAGWVESSDGVREKDGTKLEPRYVLLGDDPQGKAGASAMQKMLSDIGVNMKVEERPSSDFSKVSTERDFDIFQMGFRSSDPFGVAYFDQIYNSASELNKSGTGSEQFDEKIRELQKIGDPDEQIVKANELEREAFKTYGIMPTFNGPSIIAVKPGLANFGAAGFSQVAVQDIGWQK
ncbi:ABC-type dipeptide/oligopeptide transporter, substrate-binding lipoprotein (plasmid) [Corynebacterium glyciniphilum AJ 3170]|uniref:ABC-type dipeptide/oligopeptide transporter, substrate-binding lipoprotein n=1 Tax=Corynebacterium glyciniphilum AJ 3170 TaxID=1404245 RepID=X5DYH8_9CORY|nr:ABC transporter family substrate-binding protein [Corynebacterium glyciniphilum]AHW65672.1 ABC-type dipeptide/oligopeptide transporter, substrate-binding lipoprotein [Corynebacterium glyciniphilum AJ 3170]